MRLYQFEYSGLWPEGTFIIIAANDLQEANSIAKQTMNNAIKFRVLEIDISEPRVIIILNGDNFNYTNLNE